MRLKSIDLTCPVCEKAPKIIPYQNNDGKALGCGCHSTKRFAHIQGAISAWILRLSELKVFDGYNDIKISG